MKVRKSADKFVLIEDTQVFLFDDLGKLIAAKAALTDFIDKLAYESIIDIDSERDNEITTTQAMEYAESQGYNLVRRTVSSACERGQITGAHQVGSRWMMPEKSFLAWFDGWTDRTQKTKENPK